MASRSTRRSPQAISPGCGIWRSKRSNGLPSTATASKVVDAAPLTGDGEWLYYLRVLESAGPQRELYRVSTKTLRSSPVLPGVSMLEYDVSPDGTRAVYTTSRADGSTQLWLAALDRTAPPRAIQY